jgi:hypothetical protein
MQTKQGSYPAHAPAKAAPLKEYAHREIDRCFKTGHAVIIPPTGQEILDEPSARELAGR